MDFLNAIDYEFYPISEDKIAELCGVTTRTVRRWKSGESKPKKAFVQIIILHQRGRIMPSKWPNGWHFNSSGFLDVGHSKALAWQQIDWYFYSIQCWHATLALLPQVEARIDALMRTAPPGIVIDLQKYKDELQRLKNRPFALPADLREYYQIGERETHRKTGC